MKTNLFTTSANEAAEVVKTSLFTTSAPEAAEVVKTGRFTTSASKTVDVVKTRRFTTSASEAAEVVKTSLFTNSASKAAEVVRTSSRPTAPTVRRDSRLVSTMPERLFPPLAKRYRDLSPSVRAGVASDRFRWNSYRGPLLLDGASLVFPWGWG